LNTTAVHIATTAGHITNAGQAFEIAKGMAEPPAFWELLDWVCFFLMQLNPLLLGMLTPAITANRAVWGAASAMAQGGMLLYAAESGPLMAQTPVSPAPSPVIPGSPGISGSPGAPDSSFAAAVNAAQPLGNAASGLPSSLSGSLPQLLSSQLLSPSSQVGQLASAPESIAGLPSSMASPLTSMASPTAGSGGLGSTGADAANWYGASVGAGGPVAATLSSGGASVGGGIGASPLPIRGPGLWSTPNAANPAQNSNEVVVSRFAEASRLSSMPATSAGMGPGMVPPASAARRESSVREQALDKALETATAPYRGPPLPVVTGADGEYFPVGKEGQLSEST
jgi:hypothetical protein